jgi:two-component system alkaline phosphatase synthesis response regulator PhoP
MLIYILEDDEDIRELENYALKNSGFETRTFGNAKDFYQVFARKMPDLILLDIMLPEEDGLSVLQTIRLRPDADQIPVILVSAKSTEIDKVRGLDLGADDYLTKPFGIMELVSRVKARLRRFPEVNKSVYEYEGIVLSDEQRTVKVDKVPCELTYKEFELLKLLIAEPCKVHARTHIMDTIWGYDYEGSSRTLDMHVKTLRQKIGKKGRYIRTIRNVGFKLDKEEA